MIEEWRVFLYPLGFISSIAFGGRFLLQWIDSEFKKKCDVTRTFWILSVFGNILLWLHSGFQMQIHICAVQSCNAVIAWRNLDLMKPRKLQASKKTVYKLFACGLVVTAAIFIAQSTLFGDSSWFRAPTFASHLEDSKPLSPIWHVIGTFGIILFSLRFWVQWRDAEEKQTSFLSPAFWWTSLIGALISSVYFSILYDPVNLIGPLLGTIPYVRNLMLIRRYKY